MASSGEDTDVNVEGGRLELAGTILATAAAAAVGVNVGTVVSVMLLWKGGWRREVDFKEDLKPTFIQFSCPRVRCVNHNAALDIKFLELVSHHDSFVIYVDLLSLSFYSSDTSCLIRSNTTEIKEGR